MNLGGDTIATEDENIDLLKQSVDNAPLIWKGDYPYFIHPLTDGVPRQDAELLAAARDLVMQRVEWEGIDIILGIEAMGLPLAAALSLASGKQIQRFQDLAASQPDGLDALAELAQIRQLHQTLQARGGTAEGLRCASCTAPGMRAPSRRPPTCSSRPPRPRRPARRCGRRPTTHGRPASMPLAWMEGGAAGLLTFSVRP